MTKRKVYVLILLNVNLLLAQQSQNEIFLTTEGNSYRKFINRFNWSENFPNQQKHKDQKIWHVDAQPKLFPIQELSY